MQFPVAFDPGGSEALDPGRVAFGEAGAAGHGLPGAAFWQIEQIAAFKRRRCLQAEPGEQGRHDIDVTAGCLDNGGLRAGSQRWRQPDNQRDAGDLVI